MDKLLEQAVALVKDQGGNATLYFVAAVALAMLAWHQYLRLARHRDDLDRERLTVQRTKEELARLQAEQAKRSEAQPDRRNGVQRVSSSRVLVVEDNHEMQLIIPAMLSQCLTSPEIRVSASPSEAVEQLDRFRPELLILDMNLGEANGVEVLKYLQHAMPNVPVLVYTGYEEQAVRVLELRRETGLENLTVLPKSPDIGAFVQLVPHLFKRRATDRSLAEQAPATAGAAQRRERRVGTGDRRRVRSEARFAGIDRRGRDRAPACASEPTRPARY